MINTLKKGTLAAVPEMSLFTLRCYLKQRFECVNKSEDIEDELEIWEICIDDMLSISDNSHLNNSIVFNNYGGSNNDRFHFLWEKMMLSLIGATNISLKDFYNCGCNRNQEEDWENIVSE